MRRSERGWPIPPDAWLVSVLLGVVIRGASQDLPAAPQTATLTMSGGVSVSGKTRKAVAVRIEHTTSAMLLTDRKLDGVFWVRRVR